MRAISKIITLAAVTIGFMGISLVTQAAENNLAAGLEKSAGNDNKKRGRKDKDRSDSRDDSNSNRNNDQNSNSDSPNTDGSGSAVSSEQARKIALQRVSGTVVKEEFEQKNGRSVYEFYIRQSAMDTTGQSDWRYGGSHETSVAYEPQYSRLGEGKGISK